MIETEDRRMVHGLVLDTTVLLEAGQYIGDCACGHPVMIQDGFEDEGPDNEVQCYGCGERWRLSVIVQVERA